MRVQRVRVVVRKEVREFRRNRFVIGTMAVLPFVFLITPMITIFKVPESASGSQVKAAVGVISLLMLIIPIVLPPVIAAYSVVGERDQGTLEPVLTAPVRASELLRRQGRGRLHPFRRARLRDLPRRPGQRPLRRRPRRQQRRLAPTPAPRPTALHPAARSLGDLGRHRHLHTVKRRPRRPTARHPRRDSRCSA